MAVQGMAELMTLQQLSKVALFYTTMAYRGSCFGFIFFNIIFCLCQYLNPGPSSPQPSLCTDHAVRAPPQLNAHINVKFVFLLYKQIAFLFGSGIVVRLLFMLARNVPAVEALISHQILWLAASCWNFIGFYVYEMTVSKFTV